MCLEHDAGLDEPLAERFASNGGGEFRRKQAVESAAGHGEGFCELGVTHPINVNATLAKTSGTSFIKLLSGFGGVNGAVLFRKGGLE